MSPSAANDVGQEIRRRDVLRLMLRHRPVTSSFASEKVNSQISSPNPAIFTTKVRTAVAEPLRSVHFDKKPDIARGGSCRRNGLVMEGADGLVLRGKVDDERQLGLARSKH
jgi:hypothetical protein